MRRDYELAMRLATLENLGMPGESSVSMKPSNDPSPFSSSSHDASGQTPAQKPVVQAPSNAQANVPDSVREIMAANARQSAARQSPTGGLPVVASSYLASGQVGPFAFLPMFGATVVGALAVGLAYFFIAPHFNFLVATQAYLGLFLGGAVWLGAKAARARSSRYAATFAVLGTLLLYAVFHSATVWAEREAALDHYAPRFAKTSGLSVAATRAQLSRKLTFARATQAYWRGNFKEGVTLSDDNDKTGSGLHLTGWAFVFLTLCEVGLTAIIAAAVASSATKARFSETQGRWYKRQSAFAVSGATMWPVLRALQAADFAGARQTATQNAPKVAAVGYVKVARVAGEVGGWVEMRVSQNKKELLLYEAQVDDGALRDLGMAV